MRYGLRQQQAADDLTVATEAGNDDGRILRFGDFFHLQRVRAGIARQQRAQQQATTSNDAGYECYYFYSS